MRKTRNFFLAVWLFFGLSVALFIFSELVWAERGVPAVVTAVPPTVILQSTATPDGDPDWLIPADRINSSCDHPWVIRRTLTWPEPIGAEEGFESLMDAGLSACYKLAGEKALESHLWHQGVRWRADKSLAISEQDQIIELFFAFDADFQRLGLKNEKTVSLSGNVVHDLNGDARFNAGEPAIPDAEICIRREPLPPLCTHSDVDGHYGFTKLLPGAWTFQVSSPSTDSPGEFKYTNQLIKANYEVPETRINGHIITRRLLNQTEFNPIANEILLLVEQDDVEQDFLLMQEWATYFAAPKDKDLFQITAYYDLDIRKGRTRTFNGEPGPTYDQHDGLDASCPRGTEIVSAAEGRVIAILYNSTVVIRHSNQLISVYGHGDPLVEKNQFVPRGYPVALCNDHLTDSDPHLHFAVWKSTPWLHRVNYGIPPFGDTVSTEEKWVANRFPLEKDYYVYMLQGGRGVWTEINQPHLPYVEVLGNN